MKKLVSILLTLAVAVSLFVVPVVAAADITVGPSGDHATIQAAITAAGPGDTIIVAAGTYGPFTVTGFTGPLTIQADGVVTVQGVQSVTTAYTERDCVVFVKDSTNVVLDGLDIQGDGLGLGTKDYGVIYENSTGEINDCMVSPNTMGDMNSIAIGIWDGSEVTVDNCIVHNFGRIGIFIYNGCTVDIIGGSIEGQVYSAEGEVCYGVEVEGGLPPAEPETASHVLIDGVEIYNCDNTFNPQPSWESAGILINGWLEQGPGADSTVIVEDNDIHDNYIGIYAVKTPSSYARCNNIYDNRVYGVEGAAAGDASTVVFDAEGNWWGAADGPDVVGPGSGDKVSDDVDYTPWLTGPCTGTDVGLTVDVPDIVAISVDPTNINFGTLYPGQTSSEENVTVTNIGTHKVDVDVRVTSTSSALFRLNLQLKNSPNFSGWGHEAAWWVNIVNDLAMAAFEDVEARLPVPGDYTPKGSESGTLIFKAKAV